MSVVESVVLRYWSHVDVRGPDECWPWTAYLAPAVNQRYGRLRVDRRRFVKAHRFAWELQNGPIPPGMCVCHRCDNPPCQNVGHMFLGTVADNNADKKRKGRQPPITGEKNGRARLNEAQVVEIRERAAAGESHAGLALEFGLSHSAIGDVIRGTHWRSAPGPITSRGKGWRATA